MSGMCMQICDKLSITPTCMHRQVHESVGNHCSVPDKLSLFLSLSLSPPPWALLFVNNSPNCFYSEVHHHHPKSGCLRFLSQLLAHLFLVLFPRQLTQPKYQCPFTRICCCLLLQYLYFIQSFQSLAFNSCAHVLLHVEYQLTTYLSLHFSFSLYLSPDHVHNSLGSFFLFPRHIPSSSLPPLLLLLLPSRQLLPLCARVRCHTVFDHISPLAEHTLASL